VVNVVGAAGSTGRGEANLFGLGSFVIVEEMRRGSSPKDAGMAAMKRVVGNTVEKRLLNARGRPNFGLHYYVVNKRGELAGLTLYQSAGKEAPKFAVCDENGPRLMEMEAMFEGSPTG
jgi:N4-(beta-N-acetylglucosaminyl)-L-asparaginase